jgi:hypothetical protein
MKYSEKICPSATISAINLTWPNLGSNPGRRDARLISILVDNSVALIFQHILTSNNCMEPRPPWEATSRLPTQKFLKIIWHPNVHYRARKRPPLVPNLRQMNLVHSTPFYFCMMYINIILLPRSVRNWDSVVGIGTGYGLDDPGSEFESR